MISDIRKRTLSYDWGNNRWHVHVKEIRGRNKRRIAYWGANREPLQIMLRHERTASGTQRQIRQTGLLYVSERKPRLGPLMGILTSPGSRGLFGGVKRNFIDLSLTGEKHGAIVFIFTPEMIDWQTRQTRGYLYHNEQNVWREAMFPLPDVVYNRIPKRDGEQEPHMRDCVQALQNVPHLTLFNRGFFNKKDIYEQLQESPAISRHLPETESLSRSTLQHMLSKWVDVYLKPYNGKAGNGIFKVSHDDVSGVYVLRWQRHNSVIRMQTKSFTSLWRYLQKRMRSVSYLVQQGIQLDTLKGSPYDFRVLVQKNGQGHWELTGMGVRVAGRHRITTHVPQGGRIESAESVLGHGKINEAQAAGRDEIEQLALRIAKYLELNDDSLGEMSMDIGRDINGKLWFFEANAKPMKFDEPDIRRKSLENLIAYAQFLTFTQQQKGGV